MLAINQLLLKERFYINACLHRSSFLVLIRDECMVHSHSPLGVSLNAFNFFDPNVQVKTGKRSELSHGSCRSRQDPCYPLMPQRAAVQYARIQGYRCGCSVEMVHSIWISC